jgi:hypothetical protein
MSLMFDAMISVTIFRGWEWRYGHGVCFNVYTAILVVFYGLGVPRWTCYGGRYRQPLSFLIFGKWRFEFELSPGQRADMILFDHQTSGTTGPSGPGPRRQTEAKRIGQRLLWCQRCNFFCRLVRMLLCLQRVEKFILDA